MLMRDPTIPPPPTLPPAYHGRHWEEPPAPPPDTSPWPLWWFAFAIVLVVVVVAALMTLSGPQRNCVRPVGYQVPGTVAMPLCGTRGAGRLPAGK